VSVDVLNSDVVNSLVQKHPKILDVNLAKRVTVNGINYKRDMIVVHGFCGGLPGLSEIMRLCVIKEELTLMVKRLNSWYLEHYQAFELHPTREIAAVDLKGLADHCPLADYKVGSLRMVTLKRFVHVAGNFLFFAVTSDL